MQSCNEIKEMYLTCGAGNFEDIANLAKSAPQLELLNFETHSALSDSIDVASRLTNLQILEVTLCTHSISGNYNKWNILQGPEVLSVAQKCKKLRKLALRNCTIGKSPEMYPDMIARGITIIQSLSHLNLSFCNIDTEILVAIVAKDQLEELDLSFADISPEAFNDSLVRFNLINLQRLILKHTRVTDLWLDKVAKTCLQLKLLDVAECSNFDWTVLNAYSLREVTIISG